MPEQARVIRFPDRRRSSTPDCVDLAAREYVRAIGDGDAADCRENALANPDLLLKVFSSLRSMLDSDPTSVAAECVQIYKSLRAQTQPQLGNFDERDYFLGECALVAATAFRVLGDRSATEIWLDRSEAGFRQTVNPSPLLANVTYQRLALRCEMGRYAEVIELAPLLRETFSKLRMRRELAKCLFLEAAAFKESGHHQSAIPLLEKLSTDFFSYAPDLAAHALIELGEMHVADGTDDVATECFNKAIAIVTGLNKPALLAHLRAAVGEVFQRQGEIHKAIASYQAAVEAFQELGMRTRVAYLRLVLAQALLVAERPKEAEWQIIGALPTLDEQQMLPEGFAAIKLLAESVRRRKLDQDALTNVREYLAKK